MSDPWGRAIAWGHASDGSGGPGRRGSGERVGVALVGLRSGRRVVFVFGAGLV